MKGFSMCRGIFGALKCFKFHRPTHAPLLERRKPWTSRASLENCMTGWRMDDFSHFPQHQLSLSPSMSLWCHYNVCHDQGISKEVGTLPTSYLWTTIIPLKLDRRIKGNINNSIGATAGEDKGCKPLTKIHQRSTCPTIHPLIALYGYRAPRIIHFSRVNWIG